jgi:hypothetical protein
LGHCSKKKPNTQERALGFFEVKPDALDFFGGGFFCFGFDFST